MATMKKSTVKLPNLRTKDELLKSSPELMKLFGEDSEDRSMSPFAGAPPPPSATLRTGTSRGSPLPPVAAKGTVKPAGGLDTPRGLNGEGEELTEEQILKLELEKVKQERSVLLHSIAVVKSQAGTAGGDAQQSDIKALRKEVELKKAKLNELRQDVKRKESTFTKSRDDTTDCQRNTPGELSEEKAYIQQLQDEMKQLAEELVEAEAKNRLYYLLSERTRGEHASIDQKVRAAQASKQDSLNDLATLQAHLNAKRAAKEQAEKDLARAKRQVEETRMDWQKKLRERRREVRELKKRQQRQLEKERKARERQIERERQEKELMAKLKMEQDAYEQRVAALAPKVESMEASWNRIRTISGADTPDDVIAYWEGLRAKEEQMRQLVALAEQREAAAKAEIAKLLEGRSLMYDRPVAAPGTTANDDIDAGEQRAHTHEVELRMEQVKDKFSKLRSVAISSEQGLRSLLERLMIALEELHPDQLRQSHMKGLLEIKKGFNRPTAPRRGSSHAPQTPERKRSTTPRSGSPGASGTPPDGGKPQTPLQTSGELGSLPDRIPEGDVEDGEAPGNTLDDEHFFPELPELLTSCTERLNKVMVLAQDMEENLQAEDSDVGLPITPKAQGEGEEGHDADGTLAESERNLVKGMNRRTWAGAPLLDTIGTGHGPSLTTTFLPGIKRKKGKKKELQLQPDLNRILGYTGSDVEEDEPESEEEEEEDEENKDDGVIDRDYIKLRANKMTHRLGNGKRS